MCEYVHTFCLFKLIICLFIVGTVLLIICFYLLAAECKKCHPYATCVNNQCICNNGYNGNGYSCTCKLSGCS